MGREMVGEFCCIVRGLQFFPFCSIIDIFILPLAMDLKGHIADKIGLYRYSISTLYQITSICCLLQKNKLLKMPHVPLNRMESLFWTVILNKMGTLWGVLICCLGFQ